MKLSWKLQTLAKNGLSISNYMLRAKTLVDRLVAVGKVILECEMIVYVLNELGPRFLTFFTTFNMTQVKPFMGVLHNELKNFERMILDFKCVN